MGLSDRNGKSVYIIYVCVCVSVSVCVCAFESLLHEYVRKQICKHLTLKAMTGGAC